MTSSPVPRRAALAYAAFAAVCAAALVWPVYPWVAERAPVLVLGMPFGLVWNLGWLVAGFVALLAYHRTVHGAERGERR